MCVCVCVCVYTFTHIYIPFNSHPPSTWSSLQPYIYHYTFGVEYTTDGIPVVSYTYMYIYICVCVCVYMHITPFPLQPYIYHYTFGVEYTTDGIPVVSYIYRYKYVYMCVCVRVWVYVCVYMHIPPFLLQPYIYHYTFGVEYTTDGIPVVSYIYIYKYVYMCVCVRVWVYVCVYMHIPPFPLQPYIYHYTFGVEYTTDGIPVVSPTKEEQLTTPQRKKALITPSPSSL